MSADLFLGSAPNADPEEAAARALAVLRVFAPDAPDPGPALAAALDEIARRCRANPASRGAACPPMFVALIAVLLGETALCRWAPAPRKGVRLIWARPWVRPVGGARMDVFWVLSPRGIGAGGEERYFGD